MRHLPVIPVGSNAPDALDQIQIPIPCRVPWDSMQGDQRVRHCGECRQNVYDIASFSRPEALRMLEASAGDVCLRIYRRPDGTVITADCRTRLRAARKRGLLVFAGVLLVVLWAQLSAQFVGLMGLRRVLGGGLQGAPRVSGALATPTIVPRPPVPVMGLPELDTIHPAPAIADERLHGKPTAGRMRRKAPQPARPERQ